MVLSLRVIIRSLHATRPSGHDTKLVPNAAGNSLAHCVVTGCRGVAQWARDAREGQAPAVKELPGPEIESLAVGGEASVRSS